jgi:hypothetical protein
MYAFTNKVQSRIQSRFLRIPVASMVAQTYNPHAWVAEAE